MDLLNVFVDMLKIVSLWLKQIQRVFLYQSRTLKRKPHSMKWVTVLARKIWPTVHSDGTKGGYRV